MYKLCNKHLWLYLFLR